MSGPAIFLGAAGFVLFTLGLLIGFAIPVLRNPRMGLSAHLTAAQTGPALIVMALFWNYLAVPESFTAVIVYVLTASSYLLVLGIGLASVFGASQALPIAGKGYRAGRAKELLVSALVKGSSLAMALACVTICYFLFTNFGHSVP